MLINYPITVKNLSSDNSLLSINSKLDDKSVTQDSSCSSIYYSSYLDYSETQNERFDRRVSENLKSLKVIVQTFQEDVLRLIGNIEKLILICDRFLYKSQPPASGRIRVSWEAYDNQRYHPVIVRWIRTRNNKWRYERLSRPISAVSSKGGFLTHRTEVISTIKLIQQLISHRRDILGYLQNLGRGLTQKDRVIMDYEDTVLLTLVDLVNSVNAKGTIKVDIDELLAG